MKKTDYSNQNLGQEISGLTMTHEQDAVLESLKAITLALGVDNTKVTVLFGCVMVVNGDQYDQTAGAVVYQDEIYLVDAFSGNHAADIPVYQFDDVLNGPSVRFADLAYRDVHIDHKMKLVLGAAGSGEADYNAVEHVKDKIPVVIGVQALIDASIAALIDSSPATLDTLNELAAALGDDPNFATTVTNSIAAKVAILDIINNLTSVDTDKPLSAAMGKVLNDTKTSATQEAWSAFAYEANWQQQAARPARYRKDNFGSVEFRGGVEKTIGANAGDAWATLPVGYRPATAKRILVAPLGSIGATNYIDINTLGAISIQEMGVSFTNPLTNDGFYIDSIRFDLD